MFSRLVPRSMGDISSGTELLLNLFIVFGSGMAAQIHFLEFSKDGPTGTNLHASDTTRTYTFLLLPGI